MAFSINGVTRLGNLLKLNSNTDNTPGLFYYQTADSLATVTGAHYFDGIIGQASVGSIIHCDCNGLMNTLKVTVNDGVHVTVAKMAATASGQATTVAAVDTIVTGLAGPLKGVVITEDSDPVDDPEWCTASIGDQAGSPASGSFLLKTWKNTSGNDPTPVAATTFSKKVNWFAFE